MNVSDYLQEKKIWIDRALNDSLPSEAQYPILLHKAMRYSVLNGGKRIRPILCLAAAEAFGTTTEMASAPAMAVELFHCSTLVHDDLPCMDDDDLRRGMPACHIKFGEAYAVLTGDALIIHAFRILAENGDARLSLELAQAAGSKGVIAGQAEDLACDMQNPNEKILEFIHRNKTASLIKTAVRMGFLIGGARKSAMEKITLFGEKIGMAFQIADDILDGTSSEAVLGKPVRSDLEQNKMTYPAIHGMEAARKKVKELTAEAMAESSNLPGTRILQAIAQYLVTRRF